MHDVGSYCRVGSSKSSWSKCSEFYFGTFSRHLIQAERKSSCRYMQIIMRAPNVNWWRKGDHLNCKQCMDVLVYERLLAD